MTEFLHNYTTFIKVNSKESDFSKIRNLNQYVSQHIIFDCERAKYAYTGLYSFCKELGAAVLKQSKERGDEVSFYMPPKEYGLFGAEERYITQRSFHKIFPPKLKGYDVWHCTYQGSRYLPAAGSNLKIVSTVHDLNFLHQKKTEAKQKKYLQKVQRLIDRSTHIVAISNFVKEELLKYLKIEEPKITVIYNGLNRPSSSVFKKPTALTGDAPFFFSIGTITDKKNFHVLPAMLRNNQHHLVIAGITQSQAYYDKIIAEAKAHGVEDRLQLIGTVSESEKFWLYKHCDAFCFPSLAEGFGLPVIEAMQLGTAVILSKTTSLPEIGGPHAFYFDELDSDHITKAADTFLNTVIDDGKRKALIHWAQQFDWDIAAKKYCDLYEKVN